METSNMSETIFEFEHHKCLPELIWHGKRPYYSTQYYPAKLCESYIDNNNEWKNKLFWGDNLQVMGHLLKDYKGKIDLIYIDPPFDSKTDYKKKIEFHGNSKSKKYSFEEKQFSDTWVNDDFLQFMYERLIIMYELLSDKGCIYLHCDWHKSHHLRMIMDEVFGSENFVNEIVWHYSGAGTPKGCWAKRHDNIFLYSKTSKYTFNADDIRTDYSAATIERVSHTLNNIRNGIDYGTYTLNPLGKYPEDVLDIPIEAPSANARTGYPTQKPETLIERIIKASSNPGDLIFDCFMGSGTTQTVAMKLGRRFIGADINLASIQTTTKRLLSVAKQLNNEFLNGIKYTNFEVYNVNNYGIFSNPVKAKEMIIESLGIHAFSKSDVWDGELNGRMIKIMPINRITNKDDLKCILGNLPYDVYRKRNNDNPNQPVERITVICMGHEPDLKESFESQIAYNIDIEILDILKDDLYLQLKHKAEADIVCDNNRLIIKSFYPANLMKKVQKDAIESWHQLVDSIMIDWNYNGEVLQPSCIDIPSKNEIVKGVYDIPENSGTIRVKITDLLSESIEMEVYNK